MGKRLYLFEMTDLWMTDFETPGTRTTGGKAATLLDHRPRLERHAAGRHAADQIADALLRDPRPHLR